MTGWDGRGRRWRVPRPCVLMVLAAILGCDPLDRPPSAEGPGSLATGSDLEGRAGLDTVPGTFALGRAATEQEIDELAIAVMPDGRGLPPGSGSPDEGEEVYQASCAACHGVEGEGGTGGQLVGRIPGDAFDWGDGMQGPRTIGSFWPYATTVFDYVRRSMPWDRPGSLTDDQVYAVTAYLLYLNEIIASSDVMNAQTLPQVVMPAHGRFIPDDREEVDRVH